MSVGYGLLVLVHILLLVYWLGADVGVFYSAGYLVNPDLSIETRRTVMKIVHFIDLLPRMALVTMLPVGMTLAVAGGYAALPAGLAVPILAAIWVGAFAWLRLVVKIYHGPNPTLTKLDYVIRYAVMAGLVLLALCSILGVGPIEPRAYWLSAKLVIFAFIILCGLGIRVTFRPLADAFGRLMTEGSKPEIEQAMIDAHARVRPIVLVLWAALVVESFLGLSKLA